MAWSRGGLAPIELSVQFAIRRDLLTAGGNWRAINGAEVADTCADKGRECPASPSVGAIERPVAEAARDGSIRARKLLRFDSTSCQNGACVVPRNEAQP